MKFLGTVLLTSIGAYFVGILTLPVLGIVANGITRLDEWAWSLPIWGQAIVYIVVGYIVIELYKKLPQPKDE